MSRRLRCVAFIAVFILLTLSFHSARSQKDKKPANSQEIEPSFWVDQARKRLQKTKDHLGLPGKPAKNVILFLGDGMGISTVSASRFYKTEVEGRLGSVTPELEFEGWPFHTLVRTYDLNSVVTDSASSATAYLGGTKTTTGIIGLTGFVKPKECREYKEDEKVESVLKAAIRTKRATGIVTSTRITHASPAGAYSHAASRYWESDKSVKVDCGFVTNPPKDLALQLIEDNPDINVILGGGYRNFYPVGANGNRTDGRNLPEEWLKSKRKDGHSAAFVNDSREFLKSDYSKVDYLLGLLTPSHMPFEADRAEGEASLADMTAVAIKLLSRQPNGFFLFVEGGRIDHAHHNNLGKKALIDTLAFEKAIRKATELVDLEETLLIVTADHSHSFQLVGQPSRLKSLLDLDEEYDIYIADKKGMTPMLYSSGPSAAINSSRANLHLLNATIHNKNFSIPSLVPLPWATHSGEDVGVYATGAFSRLFHSTVDNTFIANAIKFAMCLPPFEVESHCFSTSATIGLSTLSIIGTLIVTKCNLCLT
nr:alkaline phosphatase [Hymenolepis microstoma]